MYTCTCMYLCLYIYVCVCYVYHIYIYIVHVCVCVCMCVHVLICPFLSLCMALKLAAFLICRNELHSATCHCPHWLKNCDLKSKAVDSWIHLTPLGLGLSVGSAMICLSSLFLCVHQRRLKTTSQSWWSSSFKRREAVACDTVKVSW